MTQATKELVVVWNELLEQACEMFNENTRGELERHRVEHLMKAMLAESDNRRAGCPPMYRIDDVMGLWEIE